MNVSENINLADEKNNEMQFVDKERIKELRGFAKINLLDTTINHPELSKEIHFTNKGVKEFLNQPHKLYYEKNELIKNIQHVIKNSDYKGVVNHKGKTSHIFEIEIRGEKSWIIANEYQGRGVTFYSISDSPKVLTGIKK